MFLWEAWGRIRPRPQVANVGVQIHRKTRAFSHTLSHFAASMGSGLEAIRRRLQVRDALMNIYVSCGHPSPSPGDAITTTPTTTTTTPTHQPEASQPAATQPSLRKSASQASDAAGQPAVRT